MLKERIEKGSKVKAIYRSSNILASTYDKDSGSLTLIFNSGQTYTYNGVKKTDYLQLEIAESQGKVFNQCIKPYPFEKGDKIDVAPIVDRLNQVESDEAKKLQKEVIDALQLVITVYEATQMIDLKLLDEAQATIKLFKGEKDDK